MDVSIIILNYHTRALAEACVDSVIRHTEGVSYEIILVENGSGEFTESRWPEDIVKLVVIKDNIGFAGGNNYGIKHAKGRYILLLNSDAYLISNAVAITCRFLDDHPKAGVVSPRLVFPDGRHQSAAQRFPSVKYQLLELFRVQKFMSNKAAGELLLGAFFDHKTSVTADWVWGTFFLFRAELLNHMPGNKLDDSYYMYFEDMQWCMDIWKLGYEVWFSADTEVVHLMGGSSSDKQALMKKYEQQFLERNFSTLERISIQFLKNLLSR